MKKLLLILLTLTVCFGLFAKELNTDRKVDSKITDVHQLGRAPQSSNYTRVVKEFTLNPNPDNLRYDFDVYTGNTTGLTYNAVDLATGALTPTGAIGSTPFPMAEEYDGNAIYRVYNDLTIVEVDPDDGTTTALGTISGVAGTPTGLAYKWDTSTMYIVILDGGNAPHFCTLDLTTFVATEVGVGTGMVIAMDFAADGYLYTPCIDDDNFYQVDPATGASTLIGPIGYNLNFGQDVTYDYLTDQLFTISCGEVYILGTYDLSTGALTQIADMGGNQHAVLVSTVASTEPDAPAAPSDVVVTPDAGGALSCDISWTCPDLTFGGDPLSELLEMCVYRDGELIYTDSSPVIGGPGNYTDYPTAAGLYTYSILGVNTVGEGGAVNVTVWVGEDVPDAVTDLTLIDISTDDLIAQLDWVNPTAGMHGGYFPGITGYDIVRSDGEEFDVTGSLTTWQDDTIVNPGVYFYTVTPYNGSGSGPSTSSPQVGIGISIVQVGNEEIQDYQIPMNLYWHNTIVEVVYDKEWIGTDMLINTVSFHAANIGSAINAFNFEIWLGEIDIDDLSGGFIDATQLTMVFDGTIDVPTGDYWLDIPLDTTFEYEYSNNLVLGIIKDDDEYYSTADTWWTTESGTADRSLHQYSDGTEFSIQAPPTTSNTKTTYPDVRFYYSPLEHGNVDGVITDAVTTDPIEGVEVFVGNWGPAVTNAAGEYLMEDIVIGTQPVTAFVDGYYDFIGEVEVEADVTVTYDFTMDPFEFATLDGTVTDVDTGDAIEGAEIYILSVLGYEYTATTDASGDYSIVDIIADTYDITCTATMYIPQTVQDVVFDAGAALTEDFALAISISYFSDFEDNDGYLISSDPACWQWGAPTSGPGSAYSGSNVWATVLGGDYNNGSNSTLDTTIPVGVVTTAYMLEFYHWYSIENGFDGGNVKVSTDDGANWTVINPLIAYPGTANTANPLSGEPIFCGDSAGWELAEFDLSAFIGENILVRWHFGSDSSVQYPGWYIDNVRIYEQEFGALEGYVTDFGLGNPIADAEITIGLYSGISEADGYYFIDGIVTGTYELTCVSEYFLPALIGDVVIEASTTTTQDVAMLWSEIATDVTELASYLPPDDIEVQTFTITNNGPGDLDYSISFDFPVEVSVRRSINTRKVETSRTAYNVKSQPVTRKVNNGIASLDATTAEHLGISSIPSRDAGDILSQFNPTISPWGVGYDGVYLWLSDAIAGDTNIYQYATDGTATGVSLNCPWMGSFIGDMANAPGYIFAVNVGGDNNIYKLDDVTGDVVEIIAGAWNTTSARGLAYDQANDEFYIGGWNHTEIYHIDATGATIGTIPFASVSGLAWHPSGNNGSGSLWVTESTPANNIYEIDPTTGNVLQQFTSPGDTYACAGLALDEIGNLWAIDQGTNTVYNIDSGVPLENWVMVTNNVSGTVPGNGGSIIVDVTFDATDLAIGDVLEGDLVIGNNSNYGRGDDYIIPVMLTVSGNIPPVNLLVNEETALFTWDTPPGSDRTDSGNEKQSKKEMNNRSRDLLGYKVYLDDMEEPIGTTTENEWQYDIAQLVIGDSYVAGVSAFYDDGESEVQEFPFTFIGTDAGLIIPLVTALQGNYPNPFNPVTKIAFSLNEQSHVQIMIYNIRGQLVRTLVDDQREANEYIVTWNGTDDSNKSVSSGVYFYKMKSSNYTATKKMILMK